MAIATKAPEGTAKSKEKYHHGDLRQALIAAAYELISKHGAENFSLADACRVAGVSTAAPYKHFRDRDELLECVVSQGFEVMKKQAVEAIEANGEGTPEAIVAMGNAYIDFAINEQALFRLMFGQHPKLKSAQCVLDDGRACFSTVIEQVAIYCNKNGIKGDPQEIATRLWTFVHGASSLIIDEDYQVVVPDLDVRKMVENTGPLLLKS